MITGGTLGITKIGMFSWTKSKTITNEKHTEQTAIELIHDISVLMTEPITFIIDDFDGVRECMRDKDAYIDYLLRVIRIIPTYFKSDNIRFILSLEDTITELKDDALSDNKEASNLIKAQTHQRPHHRPSCIR